MGFKEQRTENEECPHNEGMAQVLLWYALAHNLMRGLALRGACRKNGTMICRQGAKIAKNERKNQFLGAFGALAA